MKYLRIFILYLLSQYANAQGCVTPVFTQIPPICEGEVVTYTLPETSNNGIMGTWSPAEIDNFTSMIYVFTPIQDGLPESPCFESTTMSITVKSPTEPTFTIPNICEGESYTLPTTSLEGISGAWSPAFNSSVPVDNYTFTPAPNSCSNSIMLNIMTTPPTMENPATFANIGPLCAGTNFTLPSSSIEGVTGTWTPAPNNTVTTTYTFTSTPRYCVTPWTGIPMLVEIVPITSDTISISSCGDFIWSANNVTYTATGTYIFENNCHKKTLNLTIINAEPAAALSFDGIDDHLQIPHNASLNMEQFTIETWVKWGRSGAAIDFICGKDLEQMEIHTGGELNNNIRFIPTTGVWLDGGVNTITPNTWIHLACVYNPSLGLAKMYVNGVDIPLTNNGSNPLTTPVVPSSTDMIIGKRNTSENFPFEGLLDEFRVWNRALSQAEIQNRYNCEIPTSDCGLVVNLHFNQGLAKGVNTAITMVADSSGNQNNATLNNFDKSCGNTNSNFVALGGVTSGIACTANTILPVFSALPSAYSGTVVSPLPQISNNGIAGTWTPALNNLATTTYTFTPSIGLCGNLGSTELTLTIIPCPSGQTFISPNDNISSGTIFQKANQSITATNKISGGNTIYQAGNTINMNPGFEVANGAVYLTKLLAGCN
ncbi:LamG domain-containing protein [Lacihabitans sp. LS3-19]|uniref:LamG domain-containing protein n=1 Tax=Lacihabitans sp. LS3-19 TaxID=2487335 RepID=UPI0020CFA8DB|nr:LamG domain-containing protein [Lacihabitans sp. LS3-19]MCP9770925.1 LamG domain-containing protein [Lacihabitans sp. LS3-19]